MNFEKELKKILLDEDRGLTDLSNELGISLSNLSQKLKRNNFRVSEIEQILDILGYDLKIEIVKREEF